MRIQHITELFALDGPDFVIEAYRSLLQREPDPHGLAYYLGRLAQGHGKASVIYQLTKSSDCRPHHDIQGLEALIKNEKRSQHWLFRLFKRKQKNEYFLSLVTIHYNLNKNLKELSGAIAFLAQNKPIEIPRETSATSNFQKNKYISEADISNLESRLETIFAKIKIRQPWTLQQLLDKNEEDFIEAVYEAILHRKPDESGRAYFMSELHKGKSKTEIVTHILNCTEAEHQPDNFIYLNTKIDMAIAAIDGIWNNIKNRTKEST
jgi:hypothetical protein